jgi:hypothetical protein
LGPSVLVGVPIPKRIEQKWYKKLARCNLPSSRVSSFHTMEAKSTKKTKGGGNKECQNSEFLINAAAKFEKLTEVMPSTTT